MKTKKEAKKVLKDGYTKEKNEKTPKRIKNPSLQWLKKKEMKTDKLET